MNTYLQIRRQSSISSSTPGTNNTYSPSKTVMCTITIICSMKIRCKPWQCVVSSISRCMNSWTNPNIMISPTSTTLCSYKCSTTRPLVLMECYRMSRDSGPSYHSSTLLSCCAIMMNIWDRCPDSILPMIDRS